MAKKPLPEVELIPVELINVVNPRIHNKKIFKEIVANIAELGLKSWAERRWLDVPDIKI